MSTPLRFGPAASAIVLASIIAGCAMPQQKPSFGGRAEGNVGLATRALIALNAKNVPVAIDFAEQAVAKTPDDAGFRALLGNAYFAAGRFASAEAAYKDSLTLYSNQPQVILKLALVETALGKTDQAVAFLHAGRSVLDPSNYGLALALAGDQEDAIPVLDAAAREPGADATVRQNLALAHALAGDWTEARTIAEQDVPANQVDSRIHQWMLLASPKAPSDRVAALVGVKPVVSDQGQPVRLALRKPDTMMAQAAPASTAVPALAQAAPAPAPMIAQSAPVSQPQFAAAAPAVAAPPPEAAPEVVEAVAPAAPPPQAAPAVAVPAPKSMIEKAESIAAAPVAMLETAAHTAMRAVAAFVPHKSVAKPAKVRRIVAAAHRGHPGVVMQIASYRSPQQVNQGWSRLTHRYPALRAYLPMKARFDSAKGTFYRLSIQGFDNQRDAIGRCNLLKSRGGQCFVRGPAGDAPVVLASN